MSERHGEQELLGQLEAALAAERDAADRVDQLLVACREAKPPIRYRRIARLTFRFKHGRWPTEHELRIEANTLS